MTVTPITVHSWSYPTPGTTGADAIWSRPSFTPQANRTLNNTSDHEISAAMGRAVSLANIVQTIQSIKSQFGYDYTNYNIFMQNFDSNDPEYAIGQNTLDGITVGEEFVVETPFISNGLVRAKEWGSIFLDTFKQELDSRDLPYPTKMHFDNERHSIDPSGSTNVPLLFDDFYNDPRAESETLDGFQTFKEFADSFRDRNFQPLDFDSFQSGLYQLANAELIEFVIAAALRQRSYILNETLYKKAKQLFPGILVSNWEEAKYDRDFPANGGGKLYTKEYLDTGPYSDYSQVVFYTIGNQGFQGAGSTIEDWNEAFNGFTSLIPPREQEFRNLYMTSRKQNLDAAVSQRDPDRVMVWHMYPGFSPTLNNWQISNMFEFEGIDSVTNAVSGQDLVFFLDGSSVGTGKLAFLEGITNGFRGFVKDYSGGTQANAIALPDGLYALNSFFESKAFGDRWVDGGTNIYEVPVSDILSFASHAMDRGVYEHFLWQNPANMTDSRWGELAEVVKFIEETAGVLEGEILEARISKAETGSRLDVVFRNPAQIPWSQATLNEIEAKRPELMINGQVRTLSGFAATVAGGQLRVSATTGYSIQPNDECRLTVTKGWYEDTNSPIVSSATQNIRRGMNANPSASVLSLANELSPSQQVTRTIHPVREKPVYVNTTTRADSVSNSFKSPLS